MVVPSPFVERLPKRLLFVNVASHFSKAASCDDLQELPLTVRSARPHSLITKALPKLTRGFIFIMKSVLEEPPTDVDLIMVTEPAVSCSTPWALTKDFRLCVTLDRVLKTPGWV